jgi:predicted ArsR family transcriptional regulator
MTTARQKVLGYLMKTRTASAREVARALKMSAPTVRHHLRVLVSDGRLEAASVRERDSKGRPEKVYSLPRAMLGDNLSALADALLTETGSGFDPEALAARLAGEFESGNLPVVRRLNLVVEKLNGMKYHARWEAGAEGPRIILGHCPYATLIAKHPVLCQMDAALLGKLMTRSAVQTSKIGADSAICLFALG